MYTLYITKDLEPTVIYALYVFTLYNKARIQNQHQTQVYSGRLNFTPDEIYYFWNMFIN